MNGFPAFQNHQAWNRGFDQGRTSSGRPNHRTRTRYRFGQGYAIDNQRQQDRDYHDVANCYADRRSNFQTHIETTLGRFCDLYKHKGRLDDARLLSEDSVVSQMEQNRCNRLTAAFELLKDFYERCALPHSEDALKNVLLWNSYLEYHRSLDCNLTVGEVQYEKSVEELARSSALDLLTQYASFLEDRGRWSDEYIYTMKERERNTMMELQIKALNAVDQDINNELTQRRDPSHFRFRTWRRPRQSGYRGADANGANNVNEGDDEGNICHHEALANERQRLNQLSQPYYPLVRVRGQTYQDTHDVRAIIDTGNSGPNVISRRFLRLLRLESIIETNPSDHQQELSLADGSVFRPSGWISCLSFKFVELSRGWDWASFSVTDSQDYDMVIGMPFLLRSNISIGGGPNVAAPLVPDRRQQQIPTQPQRDEGIERSNRRRREQAENERRREQEENERRRREQAENERRREQTENESRTQHGPSLPRRNGVNLITASRSAMSSTRGVAVSPNNLRSSMANEAPSLDANVSWADEVTNSAAAAGVPVAGVPVAEVPVAEVPVARVPAAGVPAARLGWLHRQTQLATLDWLDLQTGPSWQPYWIGTNRQTEQERSIANPQHTQLEEPIAYPQALLEEPIANPQALLEEPIANPQTRPEEPIQNPGTRPEPIPNPRAQQNSERTRDNQTDPAGGWEVVRRRRRERSHKGKECFVRAHRQGG